MGRAEDALKAIDSVIAKGPFAATWESLANYRIPTWYEDAKFGIFIHWGAYAVPAFGNEWYPRQMYVQGSKEFEHHVKTHGPHAKFGYKDFIPMLKAERYDPAQWADLFRRSGARFVMPVAEHHDGFAMYDCAWSEWTAAKMGPRRDLVGDLARAVRDAGLVFAASSHRAEHWWFFDNGMKFDSDVRDPRNADLYGPAAPAPNDFHSAVEAGPNGAFLKDWLLRTCEIADKYRPQVVWFDWWINNLAFRPYLQKFAAYYYNRGAEWGLGVAVNYKYEAFPRGTAVFDIERGQCRDIRPLFWQTDTSVSRNSWGYVEKQDYKTAASIVHDLVDIVSKNGALLLNIGPRPDGTIPEPEREILLDIGRWLDVNGEAIYGTRPWVAFGEGPTEVSDGAFSDTKRAAFTHRDIRFTVRSETLYAIALGWPEDGALSIRSLREGFGPPKVRSVSLLGSGEKLSWSRGPDGLSVRLPSRKPCEHACVLKIV